MTARNWSRVATISVAILKIMLAHSIGHGQFITIHIPCSFAWFCANLRYAWPLEVYFHQRYFHYCHYIIIWCVQHDIQHGWLFDQPAAGKFHEFSKARVHEDLGTTHNCTVFLPRGIFDDCMIRSMTIIDYSWPASLVFVQLNFYQRAFRECSSVALCS